WAKKKAGAGEESWQSGIAKFLGAPTIEAINERLGLKDGDLVLFGAGGYDATKAGLGGLRNHLGAKHGLYVKTDLKFLWVLDFPLLELDPDSGKWKARHHPFTSPRPEDFHLLDK